jgi:EAL domain-containing protein (putative c-di-GMP-specific phosphodiesterase class I)
MASIGDSRTGMRNKGGIADLIVKGAIALVTVAFFIGAYLQFRVAFWLALIAALSVYITLLMLHTLMRRSERVDALVSEVTRLEDELSRMRPGEEEVAAAGWHRSPVAVGPSAVAPMPAAPAPAPALFPQPAAPFQQPAGSVSAPFTQPTPAPALATKALPPFERAPKPLPQARAASPAGLSPAPPASARTLSIPSAAVAQPELSPWLEASGASENMHDYWAFRPAKPTLPETSRARGKETPPTPAEREADLDAVQGMIKRLADEVSHGTDPAPSPETIARASADALSATASTMRAAVAPKAPPAPAGRNAPASMPPPIASAHGRMSSLAAALAAGRMDALIEPIMGLGDHHVHYYEASIRPRDERDMPLPTAAHDPQLARTGLLPLLDSARLKRAAQVCRTFAHQRQKYFVLTAATGEALITDAFLDDLANAYREREALAGELVLTFSQADVKSFSGTEWSNLTDMRDLGFRFGLDQTTDLDYEFTALRAAGFAFVKIDAATLLRGLSTATGIMTAPDACRSLAEVGLITIVGGIDSEPTRAKLVASGVSLGQGPLFGRPQLVASDAVGTAAA